MESSSSSSSSDAPIAARRGLRIALIGITHADVLAAWNAVRHRPGYTFTHVSLDVRIERLMNDLFGVHTHEIRSTRDAGADRLGIRPTLLARETIAMLCDHLPDRFFPSWKVRPFAHALAAADPCDDVFASSTDGVIGLALLKDLGFAIIDARTTGDWMAALDALSPRRSEPKLAPSPVSEAVAVERKKAEAAAAEAARSSLALLALGV